MQAAHPLEGAPGSAARVPVVMVVEDDPQLFNLVARLLREAG